jgi:CBS-domain-containing membrane protein
MHGKTQRERFTEKTNNINEIDEKNKYQKDEYEKMNAITEKDITGNSALAKAYAERDVQYLAALKEMARDVWNESRDTPQDSANQDKLLNKHNAKKMCGTNQGTRRKIRLTKISF